MKNFLIPICLVILLGGCEHHSKVIVTLKESYIPQADSLVYVDWIASTSTDTLNLFKIAYGGNLEILSETQITNPQSGKFHIFAIADYFQENQLFYIVFDTHSHQLYATARIYLPNWGLTDFKELSVVAANSTSIDLKLETDSLRSVYLTPLRYDENKIINYYEYQ